MVTSDKKHCSDNEEKVISLNSLKNKMHHRGNCREILLDQLWDFTPPAPSLHYFRFGRRGAKSSNLIR